MNADNKFDLIVVGTGFASTFFLYEYLKKAPKKSRILVLERGKHNSHTWQVENHLNSNIDHNQTYRKLGLPEKRWRFNIGFGGSSTCWGAETNRMLPNDFNLKTVYGVGRDWPISYEELEPYYCEAEDIMSISGPEDWSLSHRSQQFPQPSHLPSDPDRILKRAYPSLYFSSANARARIATRNRPKCCSSGVCRLCPIDAKFTILNELKSIYQDPRIHLRLSAHVLELENKRNLVSHVLYEEDGRSKKAGGELIVLGANAIFNPYILLRSGFVHPLLGKRLHEQLATYVHLDLKGIDGFQGSTVISGNGYMFYDGEHRKDYAACILFSVNRPLLRAEFGKWRQRMVLRVVFEELPLEANSVSVGSVDESALPIVEFVRHSEYALKGVAKVPSMMDELSNVLPVEKVHILGLEHGEAHIQGTVVMGNDIKDSVVDKGLVHHQYRNLLVLGNSAFPTGAPAPPTLTTSALSLYAARNLWQS